MRTPADLDHVFAKLQAEADEHLRAAHPAWTYPGTTPRERHRLRALAPLVAAAAVVLTVASLAFALTRQSSREPAAAPTVTTSPAAPRYRSMPLHQLVFSVPARIGSFSGTDSQRDYQSLELHTPYLGEVYVTFHRAGAQDPFAARGATRVEVHGRPGVYAVTDTLTHGPADLFRGIAWRYGPDEWATVWSVNYDLRKAYALKVARSVRLGRHPARTPIAIHLAGATERDWRTDGGAYVVLRDRGHVAQVTLADLPAGSSNTTTINGRTAYWSSGHTVLSIEFGPHVSVQVMAVTGGRREALRVARATSVTATPNRVSTWFDATEALP